MDVTANAPNYRSLSLKDLLEARDLYHWHLMNKANVVGTGVGLYLIRNDDPWPRPGRHTPTPSTKAQPVRPPRTFNNAGIRDYSWPCIMVLVNAWVDLDDFGASGIDPTHMVPRTLYLPDGRAAPVCIVLVEPEAPAAADAPSDLRWPGSYLGGGCPLVVEVQGQERVASAGCLVGDGHKAYVLTNRHVSGEPGAVLQAKVRGNLKPIGHSSDKQIVKAPFSDVFPEFPGRRTFLTIDVGLVDVDNIDDWTSQPFGLVDPVGDVADFNELNLGLQLIDQPVRAFGAASGLLEGKIKALFYRHKARAGYDYISEFLIAPSGKTQTRQGDSGTIWHLETKIRDDPHKATNLLRPLAVEWGGQTLAGASDARLNFALATGLSTVCELLDVDLLTDHNTGANPYWGQVGHYGIATAAISLVTEASLAALLRANLERISFTPDELTADQIREKLSNGDFVELADVPDLVWKKVAADVPGGRDYARNSGPEHPNHYADIDAPATDGGPTLRDLTLQSIANMSPDVWLHWYKANPPSDTRHDGLLPFRVWQIFDEMVRALKAKDVARFVCAAGVISHYVGDACQPLHGSYLADGYKDPSDPHAKKWPGKGVHSTYEDKMVDRFADQLLPQVAPDARSFAKPMPKIRDGRDAAFATVTLMSQIADILPPKELCDEYVKLGGGASARVVQGLWDAFGPRTSQVMGAGACYLAAIWDAAFAAAATPLPTDTGAIPEADLAKIYQDQKFVPSLTIDKIATVLSGATATAPATPRTAQKRGRARREPT